MSDPILKANTFTFVINGVPFEMLRRSTYVMALATSAKDVLGTVAGEAAVAGGEVDAKSVTNKKAVDLIERVFRVALIKPVLAPEGEQTIPGKQYTFEDLAPFHDAAFREFMASGLDASPLPSSCEDQKEPPSQERST